jgi:benzoyl-CoA reductase/2-hydroxyglutaryl-CoA dehydratase subunit BcrC/BadD/HgdB
MSYSRVIEQSDQMIRELVDAGERVLGYIYPHLPLEIIMAHGLTPSLIRTSPTVVGSYEDSLQTFACSLTRNLFSQRSTESLPPLAGIIFSGNTCDALQNVGDIWRKRFPQDTVFRITYPVGDFGAASVQYLTEEFRRFSTDLESVFASPFSDEEFKDAVSLVAEIREGLQSLYSARILAPTLISYMQLSDLVTEFLTAPTRAFLEKVMKVKGEVMDKLESLDLFEATTQLGGALLQQDLSKLDEAGKSNTPRIAIAGGMIEPRTLASLFGAVPNFSDEMIALDLLTYGFKTIFTPPAPLDGDPFTSCAKTIIGAPKEPTQEGLSKRMDFLKQILTKLSINGLVICEQSFCDPDEFEAPSLANAAEEAGVASIRLPIDPEFSDRSRLEGRIQTFLETLGNS